MIFRVWRSRFAIFLTAVLSFWGVSWGAPLSMQEHMKLQTEINRDPELNALPTIRIDSIQASVPLDDRMDADSAFDRPFVQSLRDGMAWYLAQRGMRVVDQGGDLRLTALIDSYEGWKGWGHWGVDIQIKTKIFKGSDVVLSETLRSYLKYSDEEDVEDEEKPKYKAQDLLVTFPEILFTRVGVDASEKLIALLKERSADLGSSSTRVPATKNVGRGILTIGASVANAEVFVDGQLVGTTPLEGLSLPAMTHSIEVRKAGYQSWKREVAVLDGASSRLTAELEPDKPY